MNELTTCLSSCVSFIPLSLPPHGFTVFIRATNKKNRGPSLSKKYETNFGTSFMNILYYYRKHTLYFRNKQMEKCLAGAPEK